METQKYIPFSLLFVVDVAVNNIGMLNVAIETHRSPATKHFFLLLTIVTIKYRVTIKEIDTFKVVLKRNY